jgi:hypothetical protein
MSNVKINLDHPAYRILICGPRGTRSYFLPLRAQPRPVPVSTARERSVPRARFSLFIIFVYAENYSFRGPIPSFFLFFPLLGWLEPFLQSRRERFYSSSCS